MSVQREVKRITVPVIKRMKAQGEPIAMLTAYDTLMAELLDESGVDIILVGDSGGMVMAGHENTLSVTMEEMLHYVKAVRKGVNRALLVADMPFLSYQVSVEEGVRNAGRFLQEGGAEAVKIEGGRSVAPLIERLVEIGIPVMGHLGLTPQSVHLFGGYGVQGKEAEIAEKLKQEAKSLEDAGVFSLVLEKIPARLAKEISENLKIPTIGIGAGKYCDGQVLVSHDMLGLYEKFKPKFVRRYAQLAKTMREAFINYVQDVKQRDFPDDHESY
ncbi:3-methyl-2-oxobutanoatehydroxymethyltransferase [Caldithrix abyssi DSM 13497]|uniref:3-methyl-2-oxobutanoate hydroxymethyltransferase n=1 Tax=Caldithrix abyssi DSM 13497 TaxID=880073 RepID=H1XSD8_CALAY|nr:3-methyl-2-oxobutanoate hydroxymethyltransferase [Caldithrix abyssi]APF17215.1 panB ketopantoate hydroxymethyltransferase [Caldithrix abyssi DSM 13497]EHO41350.1 3-methyl-2-oxobutanoatehydroxymethyltransferase [Caldithrix abyssi DSM 13497]